MNNHELAQIVKQVQQNRDKYFEVLFNEIYQTIHYISYKLLNSQAEAEDAAQDIILYIYNHIEELKLPEGFNNWMNKIIHNKCRDRLKRPVNQKENLGAVEFQERYEILLSPELIEGMNPEQLIQTKEREQIVLNMIEELPRKQKEVVLLYYFQEKTAREISEILSCSLGSVQNRLFNAKRSIRIKLENSKDLHLYQLYSTAGIPMILSILRKEMLSVSNAEVGAALWNRFVQYQQNFGRDSFKDLKSDRKYHEIDNDELSKQHWRNNKTLRFKLYFVAGVFIFLVIGFILVQSSVLHQEQELSSASQRLPSETHLLTGDLIYQNTIQNNQGKEKDADDQQESAEQKADSKMDRDTMAIIDMDGETVRPELDSEYTARTDIPGQDNEISEWPHIADDEAVFEVKIWNQDLAEYGFTNEAVLEDLEKENSVYMDGTVDRKETEAIYDEEVYKKSSDITYHIGEVPMIEYVKAGTFANGSTVQPDSLITYDIRATNIGNVSAPYVILKDKIPQYTELMRDSITSNYQNTETLMKASGATPTLVWIIRDLKPGESVTVSFQVKVAVQSESEQNGINYISNIAAIRVMAKTAEIDREIEYEEGFENSNEVIYQLINQQNNGDRPKTGDSSNLSALMVLSIASLFLMTGLIWSKKGRTKP